MSQLAKKQTQGSRHQLKLGSLKVEDLNAKNKRKNIEFSAALESYFEQCLKVNQMIENAQSTLVPLNIRGTFAFASKNESELDNPFTLSPYAALFKYALSEIEKVDSKITQIIGKILIPALGSIFSFLKFDKQVQPFNWMLSTNLYPKELSFNTIEAAKDACLKKHPDHAVIIRSLSETTQPGLLEKLKENGYTLVPSRQVYFLDNADGIVPAKRDYKRDLKLLQKTAFKLELFQDGIPAEDAKRMAELYKSLYIEKYSIYNPSFTPKYIQAMWKHPLFTPFAFRCPKTGTIEAMGTLFSVGDTLSMPMVGYNPNRPQNLGLYRLAMIYAMEEARKSGKNLHLSSGAPAFKTSRGGRSEIEYSAYYGQHLSLQRRIPWKLTAMILEKSIVPMMKKYQL